MTILHSRIPVVQASEFQEYVSSLACALVLVIGADHRMVGHIKRIESVSGRIELLTVPVTEDEAHLIPVARVPRLMRYVNGERTDNILLTLEVESVDAALVKLGLS